MKLINVLVIGILLLCFGCTTRSQIMINPKTGHKVNCKTEGWGLKGGPEAVAEYERLVHLYKTLGYIPIEEVEMNELPKTTESGQNNDKK